MINCSELIWGFQVFNLIIDFFKIFCMCLLILRSGTVKDVNTDNCSQNIDVEYHLLKQTHGFPVLSLFVVQSYLVFMSLNR